MQVRRKKKNRTAKSRQVAPKKRPVTTSTPSTTKAPLPRKLKKDNGEDRYQAVTGAIRRPEDTPTPETEAPSQTIEDPKTVETVEPPKTVETVQPLALKEANGEVEIRSPFDKQLTPERAKELRKLRQTYGKKLPPVVCDNCAFTQQCPQYKAGYECAFMEIIANTRIETLADIEHAQLRIIEANLQTGELGLIQQRLQGGVIDDATSARLDAAFDQLANLRRAKQEQVLGRPTDSISVSGPGLIERLFGNLPIPPEKNLKEVEAVPVPVKATEEAETAHKTTKEEELDETMANFEEI